MLALSSVSRLLKMNNPYKTPDALIHDLSYQPLPRALKSLYWLMGLAFACSFISTSIGFWNLLHEASWVFLLPWFEQVVLLALVGSAYGLVFSFYYFLVFRPLHLRKHNTSKWWLMAVLVLAMLWFWFTLLPNENPAVDVSLLDTVLASVEIGFLLLGGLIASRTSTLHYLPH